MIFIGIITKEVNMYICNSNVKRYRDLGYDVSIGEYCKISIQDIPKSSNYEIDVQCDCCGKIYKSKICTIYRNNTIKKVCCYKCANKKANESIKEKYGVDNVYYLDFVKEKKRDTNMKKYGNEYAIASKCVRDKIIGTFIDKYGSTSPMKSDFIKNKIISKNKEIYGTEYPFQNKDYLNKINQMAYEKYGKKIYSKSISSQQRHICEVIGGELNVKIGKYFADILLGNTVIEYDGLGHDLSVRLNKISMEEFYRKEEERDTFIISKGYKIIRLSSKTDILPDDKSIIKIIEDCIKSLENCNIVKFCI